MPTYYSASNANLWLWAFWLWPFGSGLWASGSRRTGGLASGPKTKAESREAPARRSRMLVGRRRSLTLGRERQRVSSQRRCKLCERAGGRTVGNRSTRRVLGTMTRADIQLAVEVVNGAPLVSTHGCEDGDGGLRAPECEKTPNRRLDQSRTASRRQRAAGRYRDGPARNRPVEYSQGIPLYRNRGVGWVSIVAAATSWHQRTDRDERCGLAGMRAKLPPRGSGDLCRRDLDNHGHL